jgi:hypothetical protein
VSIISQARKYVSTMEQDGINVSLVFQLLEPTPASSYSPRPSDPEQFDDLFDKAIAHISPQIAPFNQTVLDAFLQGFQKAWLDATFSHHDEQMDDWKLNQTYRTWLDASLAERKKMVEDQILAETAKESAINLPI